MFCYKSTKVLFAKKVEKDFQIANIMCLIITTHVTGLRILTQIHLHEEKSLAAKMNKDTPTEKDSLEN